MIYIEYKILITNRHMKFKPLNINEFITDRHRSKSSFQSSYILKYEVKKSDFTDEDNENITKQAIDVYKKNFWDDKNNTLWKNHVYSILMNQTPETDKLAKLFYKLIKNTFHNIDEIDDELINTDKPLKNVRYIDHPYSFVCSKDKRVLPKAPWHSHITQWTINGVYYSTMPEEESTLCVQDPEASPLDVVEVKLKKRMFLVFPSWVQHKPRQPKKSNEPRVCINYGYLSFKRPVLPGKYFEDSYNPNYLLW